MSPNGETLYDLEDSGYLWQYTVGAGWSLLDGGDVVSFAMSSSGTTVYALEGPGGRLVQYTVGVGWSLLTSNVVSFTMSPSGVYLYVLQSNGQYLAVQRGCLDLHLLDGCSGAAGEKADSRRPVVAARKDFRSHRRPEPYRGRPGSPCQ